MLYLVHRKSQIGRPNLSSRQETIESLCGPNTIYGMQLLVLAALFSDDLSRTYAKAVRAYFFQDEMLKTLAIFYCGSIATFGICDNENAIRLLKRNYSELKLGLALATIARIAELIQIKDVDEALCYLKDLKPRLAA